MFKKQTQIESIILLRGIAASGVCVVHFYTAHQVFYTALIDRLFFMGQLGVSIFFMISGFILPYSLYQKKYTLSNFPKFLLKRSIRIEPPYWAVIAILFVIGVIPLHLLSFKGIILHIFYLVPLFKDVKWYSAVFWTLVIEFQYYLLLGLCFPFLMKLKPLLSASLVLLASIVCVLLKVNIKDLIFTYLYDFSAGYIVFLYFAEKISLRQVVTILLIFCIFIGFTVSIVSGVMPAITGLFIIFYKARSPKALLFLGTISYSLYLTHDTVIHLYLDFVKTYITNVFVLGATTIPLCIAVAYAVNLIFEQPALKLSKKVKIN